MIATYYYSFLDYIQIVNKTKQVLVEFFLGDVEEMLNKLYKISVWSYKRIIQVTHRLFWNHVTKQLNIFGIVR